MNERIKELARQSTGASTIYMLEEEWLKFAELIVKECTNVIEGGRFLHDQAPTALFAKECSGAIKRHFGVKE
jgi:hypothetical protein